MVSDWGILLKKMRNQSGLVKSYHLPTRKPKIHNIGIIKLQKSNTFLHVCIFAILVLACEYKLSHLELALRNLAESLVLAKFDSTL